MRRPTIIVSAMFLATVLASSALTLVSSGVSEAEASSEVTELTGSPVSTAPSKKTPKKNVAPALKEKFPAYSQVVDNSSKERFRAPKWSTESGKPRSYDNDYSALRTSEKGKIARYKVKIPRNGVYSVFAWWPERLGKNASARIGVKTDSGTKWSAVNQGKDGGYWVPVGEYEMKRGDSYAIKIAPGPRGKKLVVADAMAVVRGVVAYPPDPPESKVGGQSVEKTVSAAGGVKRIPKSQVMQRARNHVGTPYGNARCRAFVQEDCSCFTRLVYRKWRSLPDSPKWQWNKGVRVARSNIRPGDLVFFDTSGDGRLGHWDHVALYAGNGYVIHANNYYRYMQVHRQKMKYLRGYWGAKRLRVYRS